MQSVWRVLLAVLMLMGLWWAMAGGAQAQCCGNFSCTKIVAGNVLDDYLGQCGQTNVGACTGVCPDGYDRDDSNCKTSGWGCRSRHPARRNAARSHPRINTEMENV
jgi:hypothetical protein